MGPWRLRPFEWPGPCQTFDSTLGSRGLLRPLYSQQVQNGDCPSLVCSHTVAWGHFKCFYRQSAALLWRLGCWDTVLTLSQNLLQAMPSSRDLISSLNPHCHSKKKALFTLVWSPVPAMLGKRCDPQLDGMMQNKKYFWHLHWDNQVLVSQRLSCYISDFCMRKSIQSCHLWQVARMDISKSPLQGIGIGVTSFQTASIKKSMAKNWQGQKIPSTVLSCKHKPKFSYF
jgi:hypothetical protein